MLLDMSEEIRKRPLSRRRAASAPAEGGAPVSESVGSRCGHDGCSESPRCNVRYVGPMSSVQAHHALHAARGVGHVWAASIVTGFAVVLTGVIAFQSAQAKGVPQTETRSQMNAAQVGQLNQRLERLEKMVRETKFACEGIDPNEEEDQQPSMDDEQAAMKKKDLMEGARPPMPMRRDAPNAEVDPNQAPAPAPAPVPTPARPEPVK